MRVKISFLKVHGSNGLIPLHHQKIVYAFLNESAQETGGPEIPFCFSSLKGTSKIINGQIRFLSSKISLVISCPDKSFLENWIKTIFEKTLVNFAKLSLVPKSYQVIEEPVFSTEMKYVCISPIIPQPSFPQTDQPPNPLDPTSHDFSDHFYNSILDRMESEGVPESQLESYSEFEITPDTQYLEQIIRNNKKFVRLYKNYNNDCMHGYLLPFSMHAHTEVQRFVWERGLGLYTRGGFGLVDTVPESATLSEPIVP